jgi:hypothetical protein
MIASALSMIRRLAGRGKPTARRRMRTSILPNQPRLSDLAMSPRLWLRRDPTHRIVRDTCPGPAANAGAAEP